MKTLTSLFICFVILLGSCKKEELQLVDGTYKGTLHVTYPTSDHTREITLELKNGRYYSTKGSGAFSAANEIIKFTDENVWLANVDMTDILNGEYRYSFDGTNLKILTRKGNVVYYEYDLEKQ